MTTPTYAILVPAGRAQALLDALRRPRHYDEEDYPDNAANALGLGTNFCPASTDDLVPLSQTGAGTPSHYYLHGPIRPDLRDRFKRIVGDVQGAEARETHPERGVERAKAKAGDVVKRGIDAVRLNRLERRKQPAEEVGRGP